MSQSAEQENELEESELHQTSQVEVDQDSPKPQTEIDESTTTTSATSESSSSGPTGETSEQGQTPVRFGRGRPKKGEVRPPKSPLPPRAEKIKTPKKKKAQVSSSVRYSRDSLFY